MSRGDFTKYENNTTDAALELERQRTGNYGADYDDIYCEDDLTFMYDEDDITDLERDERVSGDYV